MDPRPIPFPPIPLATIPEQTAFILAPPPPPPLFVTELRPPTPPSNPGAMSELPLAFFTLSSSGLAIFSTCLGRYPKRALPDPLPTKIVRSNVAQDICKKQVALFAEFPLEARHVKAPKTWYDLYEYFDAFDLWVEGPEFCLSVLRSMENGARAMEEDRAIQIDQWAQIWVSENEYVLTQHPETYDIFSMPQFNRSLVENMRPDELSTLKDALNYWRRQFLAFYAEMGRMSAQYPIRGMPTSNFGSIVHPIPSHVGPQMPTQGDAFVDQRNMDRGPTVPPVQATPQNYASFMETQRQSRSLRNENSGSFEPRARGWSNESTRNGRGGNRGGRGGNYNNRRWAGPPRASPPLQPGLVEPVYHLTNGQQRKNSINLGSQQSRSHAGNETRQYPPPSQCTVSANSSRRGTMVMNDARVSSSSSFRQGTFSNGRDRVFSSSAVSQGTVTQEPAPTILQAACELIKSLGATAMPDSLSSANNASDGSENNEPRYRERRHENGAVTFLYSEDQSPSSEESLRTVYVRNFDERLFWNHELKEMMSEVGDVESIHYLFPAAFVSFKDDNMAPKAITRWNNTYMAPNVALEVSLPRPRAPRDRSGSYTSQGSFGRYSSYEQNGDFDRRNPGPRRYSLRNQRPNVTFHVRQPSGLSELRAAVQEVVHHRLVPTQSKQQMPSENMENSQPNQFVSVPFDRQLPLGNIENLQSSFVKKQDDRAAECQSRGTDSDFSYQTKMMNKENSPTKYSQGSRGGTKNKKKKGSRQNTSTQPTPMATPVKNRSNIRLTEGPEIQAQQTAVDNYRDHLLRDNTDTPLQVKDTLKENIPLLPKPSTESVFLQRNENKMEVQSKKNKKLKNWNKKSSAKSDGVHPMSRNSSFVTDASSETISPVGTEFTGFGRTSKPTSDTSFSTLPSRKPSVVLSDTSGPPFTESFRSRKFDRSVDESKEPSSHLFNATKHDGNHGTNSENHDMPTDTSRPDTDRKAYSQGHSKKHSNSSAASNKSLRKADFGKPKKVENAAVDKIVMSTSDVSQLSNSKTTPNEALTEASSTKSTAESVQQPSTTSKIDLGDQAEFPALQPAKSHVSTIADGKRPSPVQASAMTPAPSSEVVVDKKKGRSIPIVAVPRTFKPRNQP